MALWQANHIKQQLEKIHTKLTFELLELTTQGDQQQNIPLTNIGGKNLFVKELQRALLNHEADIAVHSTKDMSVQGSPGLTLAVICKRDDPRDVLVSNCYSNFNSLPNNAVIGTSSPRRQSILLSLRSDLTIKMCRGNVNTRLKKLEEGEFDAIILAAAGLERLNFLERVSEYFDPQIFIPAIAQGALGIECRDDDEKIKALIQPLNHLHTYYCVQAERAVNKTLGGNCHTPIAAYAIIEHNRLFLKALVGSLDGKKIIKSEIEGGVHQAEFLGKQLANILLEKGAVALLNL